MKRYIVTGASGVVGSALLEKAAGRTDIEMVALTRGDIAGCGQMPNVRWAQTDYSEESLTRLFEGADAVFHLAGTKGDKTELSDFEGDLVMAENLLDAAVKCEVPCVIYASSRLIYCDPETVPWKEEMAPAPRTAYGINKVRCEELCRRYSEQHGLTTVAVRIAQVLSETDHMRNMVNVFRDLASQGKQLTVIGKSMAKRQYIYSRDLAEILIRLTSAGISGFNIVNIGMEQSYTNLEIAEAFNRAYGSDVPVNYDDSRPETITPSMMDVSKMTALTGFIPGDMDSSLSDMAARMR